MLYSAKFHNSIYVLECIVTYTQITNTECHIMDRGGTEHRTVTLDDNSANLCDVKLYTPHSICHSLETHCNYVLLMCV